MEVYNEIPFGMSQYQIKTFVNSQETPERQYRNCLLQLSQKKHAIHDCKIRRMRIQVDIDEIHEKLKTSAKYEKKRLEIDLMEKEYNMKEEVKLIEDCYYEIKTYEAILETLPSFTREEFEAGEERYWKGRLMNNLKIDLLSGGRIETGTIAALEQTGIAVGRNEQGQLAYVDNNKLLEDK